VRAWAIARDDGKFSDAPYMFIKTTKPHRSVAGKTERIVRVTIVPDGTPSAEAEVRKLRKALRRALKRLGGPRMCIDYGWQQVADEIDAALRRRG
jgi:hypothetical protein